jgi:urea-proton symporter
MINPEASDERIRKMATYIIVGLGVVTWMICYGRLANLVVVLFLSGPLVSSAIWPVLGGLYWNKPNRLGATLAMLCGSTVGLICYWEIGWFAASLVSTVVSMCIMLASNFFSSGNNTYDWSRLADQKHS